MPVLISVTPMPPTIEPSLLPPVQVPTAVDTRTLLIDQSLKILQALKNKDLAVLVGFVHPVTGLRFSPSAFVQDTHRVYNPVALRSAFSDNTIVQWGIGEGSGLPLEYTFTDYYDQFVYSQDFANAPQMGYNNQLVSGSTPYNIAEFYPGAVFVEFHFPGFDPKYEGLDWESLSLVFQPVDGQWYLVGIVNSAWTP
ncbi:MAG: hypothetical protein HGA86_03135 [Anaerolineaceae bacterium]|nr:hypothetical protein [Anaerolineaceae bacterium]